MIQYPRQCDQCDSVLNSPTAYCVHIKTHQPVPTGAVCWSCGGEARFTNTKGQYVCSRPTHQCPAYKVRHSATVTAQWKANEWVERREQNRNRTLNETPDQKKARADKQSATKRAKSGTITPESTKEYRHYARKIHERAQHWARKQGHTLGRHTYHVDHKLSVNDAWRAGLPEDIVNHPANLRILEAKANSSKGSKSILTVEELLTLIEQYATS